MKVRNASLTDLKEILSIYETARAFMKKTGNPDQWKDTDPTPESITEDMEAGNLYILHDSNDIEGVFSFIPHADPTYNFIEGEWLDDKPYCAVHKVASAGKRKGILSAVMDYAFSRVDSIRIDTHNDNAVMQHQLEKYGFTRCGTIYLPNGEPRIAYQMRK